MSPQELQGRPTKFFGTVEAWDADEVSSLSFVLHVVIEVRDFPGIHSSLVNKNLIATAGSHLWAAVSVKVATGRSLQLMDVYAFWRTQGELRKAAAAQAC